MHKSTLFSVRTSIEAASLRFETNARNLWRSGVGGDHTTDNSDDIKSLISIKTLRNDDGLSSTNDNKNPSQAFIKIPMDDRNKYKKLNSNDITSDDSDSEFYASNDQHPIQSASNSNNNAIPSTSKSKIFNIPEKIHAVYQKVDKTQLKVPIVKKLRSKVNSNDNNNKKNKVNKQKKKVFNNAATNNEDDLQSDNDSIGSASDLRANDDFNEDQTVVTSKPNLNMDGISESIKTCGSSAYHAECESVTTNEDDVSRVVTKIRVKKRDRERDRINPIIDDEGQSPEDDNIDIDEEIRNQYNNDKPLLMDDELDYDSSENNTDSKLFNKGNNGIMREDEDNIELDVFAMAPFKMPVGVPKRSKRIPKYKPTAVTIPEDPNLLDFNSSMESNDMKSPIYSSTPKKIDKYNIPPNTTASNAPVTVVSIVEETKPINLENFATFPNPPVTTDHQTKNLPKVQSTSDYGIVTVNRTIVHLSEKTSPEKDLFGSEPFLDTNVVVSTVINKSQTKNISNLQELQTQPQVTHPNPLVPPKPKVTQVAPIVIQPKSLVTVNQSIVIDKNLSSSAEFLAQTHQPQNTNLQIVVSAQKLSNHKMNASKNFINYSQVDHLQKDELYPIADCNYLKFQCDDDEEGTTTDEFNTTKITNPMSSLKRSSKKDKSKYNYLKEKSKSKDEQSTIATTASSVRVLPTKLTQKVKENVSGYIKVSSNKSKKNDNSLRQDSPPYMSNSSTKIGFSNLSFEDFPSDQELDNEKVSEVNRSGLTPFEVLRNDNDKKFGSLKRRSNPFS